MMKTFDVMKSYLHLTYCLSRKPLGWLAWYWIEDMHMYCGWKCDYENAYI
jgi:hypothetical protein